MQYHSYLDSSVGTGASTINDMRSADSVAYGIGVSTDFYVAGVSTFVGISTILLGFTSFKSFTNFWLFL